MSSRPPWVPGPLPQWFRSPGAMSAARPPLWAGCGRSQFSTEEVWLHPNGKIAYLGTGGGGDRMYAIDISDPANPVVTDSMMANTRRVNDIMTTPDGKFLVFTREGASDRKNGIVIASLDDPAHPKKIAEFTEGVTGGRALDLHLPAAQVRHPRLPHQRRHRLDARHRYQRSVPSQGSVAAGPPGPIDGQLAARHRRAGWLGLPELLERRPGDPRRRQRDQGRQSPPIRSWSPSSSTTSTSLSRRRGDRRPRLHPRHPHRLAPRQLRLHRRRGLPGRTGEGCARMPPPAGPTVACRWST